MVIKKNSLKEAPYDSRGNLMHYATRQTYTNWMGTQPVWRPNDPQELRLTIDGVRSGRSAKYVMWTTPDGLCHPMFVVDLIEMIKDGVTMTSGTVWGMFQVRKRGQNFGLTYVGKVSEATP